MATLENKLRTMTFDDAANEVVITRANLRIVNGLGVTDTTNGLGNIIVGYNESRVGETCPSLHVGDVSDPIIIEPPCTDIRTGSHNVVLGRQNNFSSFGGLVVGRFNEISGQFASVSRGEVNTASGDLASVSGGSDNTASEFASSVSRGLGNTVIGSHSSISGGEFGKVRGSLSSISGGECNKVSGDGASISGGYNITQWSGYPLSLWPLSDLLRSAHRQHLPATPVAGPCPSASGESACLTVSGVQHTRPPMPQSRQKTPILRAASGLPTA